MASKTAKKPASADAVLEDLRERLEELRDTALEQIRDAVEQAERVEARYWTAREELGESRTRLVSMREEYEALPLKSHTARMRGQTDYEQKLNSRFQELEPLIAADEERVRALAAECDHLVHGSARALPSAGATVVAYGPALRTAQPHRDAFDTLSEQLEALLEETRKPVDREHGDLLALLRTQGARVEAAYKEGGYQHAQEVPSH